ncbi:sulfite exporter TauE/SafE family protein [uncultured Clostridium sp.]|uniref:urease accessory protein UreH domain-containing protein n=1 Tax=uncultured Clostridium sp. TaxID=59620 RepID=UPI0028EBDE0E|nr:sulfite exporter TauE/SafE family protein [uncultured Clostridium sp.]
MQINIKTMELIIDGMTCVNCENKIQRKLSCVAGIQKVNVSYNKGIAKIRYDSDIISINDIKNIIEKLDYKVIKDRKNLKGHIENKKIFGILIVILAIYKLLQYFGLNNLFNSFQEAREDMEYRMLFIIGLVTSVHCIAMCGGINLSQCISLTEKQNKNSNCKHTSTLRPSALYNLGRVISYTIVGGIVGSVGSVVSLSGNGKGIIQVSAGVFMVIMGLNMLNIFPWLRKFNPRMPKIFKEKMYSEKKSNSPLYVGLLNGLMPCGPLQAMQLYALSTGSLIKGAFSMFIFSLGTVPLMFGLGALSSILSKKFTGKVMKVGAVLVIVLGISMLNSGLSLSGFSTLNLSSGNTVNQALIEDGAQIVKTNLSSGSYETISVKKGIPVKWIINVERGTLNGCNNKIQISEYGIEKKLQFGENVIEFIPEKTGTFSYSCWMGMIRNSIKVY